VNSSNSATQASDALTRPSELRAVAIDKRSIFARLFGNLRNLILWGIWAALFVIWLFTLENEMSNGHYEAIALAVISVVLWFILFFAEGIELAATDLLDKQPEQLHDPATREVLAEIQSRSRFFIAQRQVFVVVIISFTSLAINYDSIVMPFAGESSDPLLRFLFTLLFNTLTVLWFCQVTPKQLAIFNSELFLDQSRSVWGLIKLVGLLGLPNPSEGILSMIQRHSAYGRRRQLLPSRAAYYNVSTHRYGVSLDKLQTSIEIRADGRARIHKRFLTLFLHGRHGVISGSVDAPSAFVSEPSLRFLALHLVTIPERFEYIASELDALFEERPFSSSSIGPNQIEDWLSNVTMDVIPNFARPGQLAEWTIEGERLPESFWTEGPSGDDRRLAALLYEVEAEIQPGAFSENRSWSETFSLPCRSYSLTLNSKQEGEGNIALDACTVTLAESDALLHDESESYSYAAMLARDNVLTVDCPLQGATYTATWRHYERAGVT
jgi:hypothetical protein